MDTVLYEKEGNVAVIKLNKPETYNALNDQVLNDLEEAFGMAADDSEVKAVVISSTSDKVFSAGADLKTAGKMTKEQAVALVEHGQMVYRKIDSFPKPVVAGVNALALGGGLEMSLACDARVLADGAKVGSPEVAIGLIPAWGGTQRLPKLVGAGIAAEMVLTGGQIGAKDALEIGLANKVVPAAKVLEEAKALALELVGK